MAEAEDVITDVARHATAYAQGVWRRHVPHSPRPRSLLLHGVAERLDILLTAAFGRGFPIRVAQAPARATLLHKLLSRRHGPRAEQALPSTDGESIWLPADIGARDAGQAQQRYRVLACQQAMRAVRGAARSLDDTPALVQDLYLLLEAVAADATLAALLPGMASSIDAQRRTALRARPALDHFSPAGRKLEALVREILAADCTSAPPGMPVTRCALVSLQTAREMAIEYERAHEAHSRRPRRWLLKDWWTGELRAPPATTQASVQAPTCDPDARRPSSARLERTPQLREALPDEDRQEQAAWMVQSNVPNEHVEDPIGLQRPTDRDESTAAEEFADSFSELPEARLVVTAGAPKEILISDDPPPSQAKAATQAPQAASTLIRYPEWDYAQRAYRHPGATLRLLDAPAGDRAWVARTVNEYAATIQTVRRRFEMLRARRVRLHRQMDGEEIDLQACLESYADYRAGRPLSQALYQTSRPARRDLAVGLLVDISGSTDAWLTGHRRVIDVEREALLLVCMALESLGSPYTVQAFSGEGPDHVTMRSVKRFDERYGMDVAMRIAALEPERYTRVGAPLRHMSALLMREAAAHRLLLLLSDGKPNDVDVYDGRYGVEDMRQAVIEARMQGIFCFCLTVDRQAASYLPKVFGAAQYALLPQPELLPTVLLDWMKRLIAA